MSYIKSFAGRIPVKYHPVLFWGTLILILAAGVAALVYATPHGPGLINDSVVYIGGAENIRAGHGYSRTSGGGEIKPLTVNVPLYSYTLAAVASAGVSMIKAGWLISLFCFALNGMFSALLVMKLTRSRLWAVVGAVFVVTSESVIRAHTFALSEPLFITLMLASLLALLYALERHEWYFTAAAGVLVSLTYLTRYIGLSLLATGVAAFFVFMPTWKSRFIKIGWFLLFSLLGGLAWVARNMMVSGTAANRSLLYHPLTSDKLREGTQTLLSFLFPERLNLYEHFPRLSDSFAISLIIALVVLVYIFWRLGKMNEEKTQPGWRGAFLFTIQSLFYLVVLLLSLTFLDASTALENRILVPSFVCLILIFVYILHGLWKRGGWACGISVAVMMLVFLAGAYDGRRAVIDLHADGQGYASAYYRNSLTIDALKRMPASTIWTNRVPAVNLLAERPAYALLAPIDPLTRQKRPNYDSSLRNIRQSILDGKAILVVFEAGMLLDDPVEGQWLRDLTVDIPAVFKAEDGMIFAVNK